MNVLHDEDGGTPMFGVTRTALRPWGLLVVAATGDCGREQAQSS